MRGDIEEALSLACTYRLTHLQEQRILRQPLYRLQQQTSKTHRAQNLLLHLHPHKLAKHALAISHVIFDKLDYRFKPMEIPLVHFEPTDPSFEHGPKGSNIQYFSSSPHIPLSGGYDPMRMRDSFEGVEELGYTLWNPIDPLALRRLKRDGKESEDRSHRLDKNVLGLAHLPHDLLTFDLERSMGL